MSTRPCAQIRALTPVWKTRLRIQRVSPHDVRLGWTRARATHHLWLLLHFADLSPSFLTLVFGENIVALRRRT